MYKILSKILECRANLTDFKFEGKVDKIKLNLPRGMNSFVQKIIFVSINKKLPDFEKSYIENKLPSLNNLVLELKENFSPISSVTKFLEKFDSIDHFAIKRGRIDLNSENIFFNLINVKKLEVFFSKFPSGIPKNLFKMNKNLESLKILFIEINEMPEGLFDNLLKLKEIKIYSSEIEILPARIFSKLINLELIDLSINGIKTLPRHLFSTNFKLKKILMNKNQIESLDLDIFHNLEQLELIEMNANKIKELSPMLFINCPKLKNVEFGANQIEEIHADLFKNNLDLEFVHFSGNKIRRVFVDFSRFLKLENLVMR